VAPIVVAIAFLACGAITLLSMGRGRAGSGPIPGDSDVLSVTASLPGGNWDPGPVAEFQIPTKYVPRLLAAFRPPVRIKRPSTWDWDGQAMATLRIRSRDNRETVATVYFTGKTSVAFLINDAAYARGGHYRPTSLAFDPKQGRQPEFDMYVCEAMVVAKIIHDLHEDLRRGENLEALEEGFATLEKSAGELPPDVILPRE
jgi:hypothetical protein